MTQSTNSDGGSGIYASMIDPILIFRDITDMGNMSGKIPGFGNQIFDSPYHSTNYPFIVPILGGN